MVGPFRRARRGRNTSSEAATRRRRAFRAKGAETAGIDKLLEMLARGDFDLVAVERALIVNPDWPKKIRDGHLDRLRPYTPESLATLE